MSSDDMASPKISSEIRFCKTYKRQKSDQKEEKDDSDCDSDDRLYRRPAVDDDTTSLITGTSSTALIRKEDYGLGISARECG